MQRIHIIHGLPCVAGTDVSVAAVLKLLEQGHAYQEIRTKHFPDLTPADIRACVRFAQRYGAEHRLPFASAQDPYPDYRAGSNSWFGFGIPVMIAVFGSMLLMIYIRGLKPSGASPAPTPIAVPWIKQGDTAYAAQNYGDAEKAYLLALKANPRDAVACNNLGLVYYKERRLADAESQYRQAAELDRKDSTAHFNLGILLGAQTRLVEAESEYVRALTINPNDADALNNLGNIYFQQQRYSDAIRKYEQALVIAPGNKMAAENMQDAKRMLTRPSAAPPDSSGDSSGPRQLSP